MEMPDPIRPQAKGPRRTTAAILSCEMPFVELSERELKYLATMNAQNIFVMRHITTKNNTVLPDLSIAERIQAKFAALLPDALPDPFAQPAAEYSQRAPLTRASPVKRPKKR